VVKLSPRGEVEVDAQGRTSVPGVFAAGDCTVVPYKQIVIAVGEGAKAVAGRFRSPHSRAAVRSRLGVVSAGGTAVGVRMSAAVFPHRLSSGVVVGQLGAAKIEILAAAGLSQLGFSQGLVEAGETPIDAALREVREETTLDDLSSTGVSSSWRLVPTTRARFPALHSASKRMECCCRSIRISQAGAP